MSAPTLNSNLSLLVIPGFSLVGKMIDSRPDWRAVDFCALQSDSAGIRPITCSRASRQGAGGLAGWGGRTAGASAGCTPTPPQPPFFCRPQGTVACGGGRQRRRLQETQSDLPGDASRNWGEVRFSAAAQQKQREEKVTAIVWQQRSEETTMTRFPPRSDARYLDPLMTKLCKTFL